MSKKLSSKEVEFDMDGQEAQLVSRGKIEVGDDVTVSWGGEDFKCRVVKVKAASVKVHYVGWNTGYDEWVSTEEGVVKLPEEEDEPGLENVPEDAKDAEETQDENSDTGEDSGDQSGAGS